MTLSRSSCKQATTLCPLRSPRPDTSNYIELLFYLGLVVKLCDGHMILCIRDGVVYWLLEHQQIVVYFDGVSEIERITTGGSRTSHLGSRLGDASNGSFSAKIFHSQKISC